MWYENSQTWAQLEPFIPGVGILVGCALAIAAAIATVRFFLGTGEITERVGILRQHWTKIAGFTLGTAFLVGGILNTKIFDLFADNAGMNAIKQNAQAQSDSPFTPTNQAWKDSQIGVLESPEPLDSTMDGTVNSGNTYGLTDESLYDKAYRTADEHASAGNQGADWANVFLALDEADYWDYESVAADQGMKDKLAQLGVTDIQDPILYEGARDDGSAESKVAMAKSIRYSADYWRNVLSTAGK